MQSQYVKNMPEILATLQGEDASNGHQAGKREETETIHVYPVEGGGILFTKPPLDEDIPEPPIVESNTPTTRPPAQPQHTEYPYYLHCILLLLLFLFLDSIGGILTDLFTPTATITILPNVRSISLQSTLPLGKLLEPLTVSESQTVPTTGHGHQDAERATGTVTFYNGLFTQQFIAQGTVFTGSDEVSIVTTQPTSVPAGNPNVGYGTATVTAQAVQVGASGNINAGDINITISNGLLVKNTPFYGGQDERDYKIVIQADRDTAAATLKAKVTASMSAALQEQLTPTEELQKVPCTPTVTTDHEVGDEAGNVTVTVAETCTAIAYNTQELQVKAIQLLSTQATKTLGTGYMLYGNVQVSVTKATTQQTVVLSFTTTAKFAYQLNVATQRSIKTLITGKPRNAALHMLMHLPGIHQANISGIQDNQMLPDTAHIHLLIVFLVS